MSGRGLGLQVTHLILVSSSEMAEARPKPDLILSSRLVWWPKSGRRKRFTNVEPEQTKLDLRRVGAVNGCAKSEAKFRRSSLVGGLDDVVSDSELSSGCRLVTQKRSSLDLKEPQILLPRHYSRWRWCFRPSASRGRLHDHSSHYRGGGGLNGGVRAKANKSRLVVRLLGGGGTPVWGG